MAVPGEGLVAQGWHRCACSIWDQMWPTGCLCTVEVGPITSSELRHIFIQPYQKRQGGTR